MPPDTASAGSARVVFFRHLPKTAGTSLFTTLANVYGDAACRRVVGERETFATLADRVAEAVTHGASLVTGHVPVGTVADDVFAAEFTILRDPVERVLSLRRFLEGRPAAERRTMGLGDAIGVGEMLASLDPQVFAQASNGMARFFCGNVPFADPEAAEFWQAPSAPVIEACVARLARLAVGTVEEMPATLRRLEHRLRIPYRLEVPHENTTRKGHDEASLGEMHALVAANAADLVIHRAVMDRLRTPASCGVTSPDHRTLFDPRPGTRYGPAVVPGRQGFEVFEPSSALAWIGASGQGRIHLAPAARPVTLAFRVHPIVPHYPLKDVVIRVDGAPWPVAGSFEGDDPVLRPAPIPAHDGVLEIAIEQPYAVPVAAIQPGAQDTRRLGVALREVICAGA